jgi:hypothetical protein
MVVKEAKNRKSWLKTWPMPETPHQVVVNATE